MQYKIISLFSGGGGLDYGFEAAGFDTSVCIEMDKWSCRTLRHNRDWTVIEDRIENVSSKEILEKGKLKKGEASLLIGGPPCQPFSKSSYWFNGDTKRLNDPRANTLEHYMRVLNDTLPSAFVLENVFGLAYKGKDEGLQFLENALDLINKNNNVNYSFKWKVLNAADYGVPQIRERVFIVGHIDGKEFTFPPKSHFNPQKNSGQISIFDDLEPYTTAWDSIGDLDLVEKVPLKSEVGGKWGNLLPYIPPGENYLYHTERGEGSEIFKWRSRYWSFLLKLHPDRPSWTIQAQPGTSIGPFHWNNRRLTMREMARIQTFPDNVEILGGISNIQKQLGNAVPSALAEVLGKEILEQFFDKKNSSTITLIPNKKKRYKRIGFNNSIPNKYLEMSAVE
ncbi:DNA cytosine methyltransferase [Flagellimonas marinaquae]|uniref:DNA cytosine methyltransferase n=1 Tax=Flagellimonas marinaquae TaxID=254955 RepID=UPI002074D5B3|nr:DNA cytosine methyltransferase [Allomuricauda aquimarina]USD24570.1 DNA cytosine methyltransferase [Allomuricauda aquimarina]